MQYKDEATPIGFTPNGLRNRLVVIAGESLPKYQNGIIVIKATINGKEQRLLFHMDGLLSVIYNCYDVSNPFKFGDRKKNQEEF